MRFAAKAESLVQSAADLLDGHHGSASGLCMAPPASKGKGKAKGKGESFDQKTARINTEIANATSAQDSTELAYLWKVLNGHLNSTTWTPPAVDKGSASKSKGGSKGKGPGAFAATNQANVKVQGSATQLAAAVDKAVAAALNKATTAEVQAKKKEEENAERNRLKKLKNEQAAADRKAAGLTAKETRFCTACLFQGTYATSMKCFDCKVPFAAPLVPTPSTPPPAPAAAASAASTKAATALSELKDAAVSRLKGYAEAVKAGASPPPPPPGAAANAPPPPPPQPGVAAAPVAGLAARTPEQEAAAAASAADLATAKHLTDLRTKRSKAASQLEGFEDPGILRALRVHIASLDAELLAAQTTREATLQPHQLGQVLTQRQQAASEAALAAKAAQETADAAVATFDKEARAHDEEYLEYIRTLVAAQAQVQQKAIADRVTLVERLTKGTAAAHAKAAESKRLLEHAQKTHANQSGAAQAEAAANLVRQTEAAQAQDATLQLHLQQQTQLKQQLAETEAKLASQQAELTRQQTAMRPSLASLVPAAQLPAPMMPERKDAAEAMFSLRANLLLLAEQETPVIVTWGDLAAGHLHWPDATKLVPFHVIEESVKGIDASSGPLSDAPVPRRVLELLRKQLDTIVSLWTQDNASQVTKAEERHALSCWAQNVLDQAGRLRDHKRHAPESSQPHSKPRMDVDVPSTQVDADAPAEVPATQLDGAAAASTTTD